MRDVPCDVATSRERDGDSSVAVDLSNSTLEVYSDTSIAKDGDKSVATLMKAILMKHLRAEEEVRKCAAVE